MRLSSSVAVLAAVVLAAAGCGSDDSPQAEEPPVSTSSSAATVSSSPTTSAPPALNTPVGLEFNTAVDGDIVEVIGQTDLPDGAVLSVSLARVSVAMNDPEKGYIEVDRAQATVQDGQFSATLSDNANANPRSFVDSYNFNEPPEAHLVLLDEVEVKVTFNTDDDQPADVVEAVGGIDGSLLKDSPVADSWGSGAEKRTTLEATVEIAKPA